MTLRKNKGGCSEYAELTNQTYTLLDKALKGGKRGGCHSYGDANASSYMLSQEKKGGKRGGFTYGDANASSYMLANKKGGKRGGDLVSNLQNLYGTITSSSAPAPSATPSAPAPSATTPSATTAPAPSATTPATPASKGGCGCHSSIRNVRKGGAIELAPFAAAVALMAARYMSDVKNFDDDIFNSLSPKSKSKKSTTKPKSATKPKTKSSTKKY